MCFGCFPDDLDAHSPVPTGDISSPFFSPFFLILCPKKLPWFSFSSWQLFILLGRGNYQIPVPIVWVSQVSKLWWQPTWFHRFLPSVKHRALNTVHLALGWAPNSGWVHSCSSPGHEKPVWQHQGLCNAREVFKSCVSSTEQTQRAPQRTAEQLSSCANLSLLPSGILLLSQAAEDDFWHMWL